jgi:hypothetical protein
MQRKNATNHLKTAIATKLGKSPMMKRTNQHVNFMVSQLESPAISHSLPKHRVVLEGVSWQQYEILLATFGDDFPALRLSYLEGTLEIITTSPLHEELKKMIGMLMEAYFQETRTWYHARRFARWLNNADLSRMNAIASGRKRGVGKLTDELNCLARSNAPE